MRILRDVLKNLIRNVDISLASIAAVMATLFVLGMFWLFILNVQMGIVGLYSQFEVWVTLKDDIKLTDQQNIYNKIKASKGVIDITLENKKQASANMKKKLENRDKNLLAHFEYDPHLSAEYTIKVNRPDDISKIVSQINGLQGINEINGGQSIPRKILAIAKIIQWGGVMIFLIFTIVSFFLIRNTIKLAIYPRRNEINIMQYVGATDWFIIEPFIFEGIIIGLLGAMSAVIVIYFLYSLIYGQVVPYLTTIFISSISPYFIITTMSWIFIFIGITLCIAGNIFVIKKFLVV